MRSHELGRRSEEIAARYLVANGWAVVEQNYRAGHKEIDIIARRSTTVAFVEVKARAGAGYGHPLEAITWAKRREISHVARVWIVRNPAAGLEYRFDAIAVTWSGASCRIEHVEDAWRL